MQKKLLIKSLFIFSLSLLLTQGAIAQKKTSQNPIDTTLNQNVKSPLRASIYSAVLPGAGQIYNRKIWKAPIVWAGMGTFGYFTFSNHHQFMRFKKAYLLRKDGGVDEFYNVLTPQGLINEMDRYRRFRDLSIVGATLFYILQIIDANVDASLSDFDVGDDLSLKIKPMNYSQHSFFASDLPPVGLSVSLNF